VLGLCFELVFSIWAGVDVWSYILYCIILLLYIIIHILLYYTLHIYYYILYILYIIQYSSLLFLSSCSLPFLLFPPSSHSKYTCRYLHILIYILPSRPSSSQSDPARSIGSCFELVFGSGLTLGVILYIIYYIISYTIIIHILLYYTLLFYLFLFCSSNLLFHPLHLFLSYIHSILVGTYIYLFILFHYSFPNIPFLPNPSQTRYPSLKWIHLSIFRFKRNLSIYL
jgi:hypothetical protein